MAAKDKTVYVGKFRGLRVVAFGRSQTLAVDMEIQVYQEKASPALWRSRNAVEPGTLAWSGGTPESVMDQIAAAFERCVDKWQPWHVGPFGIAEKKGPQSVSDLRRPGRSRIIMPG